MEKENVWVHAEERLDDLQLKGYQIIQDPKRFCFGVDAVLLAHFAKIKNNDRVLDLGTGTGILPILLHAITNESAGEVRQSFAKEFVGLEIQSASVVMAQRSVKLNGIEHQVRIVEGDIKEAADLFDAASFQVVTTNPPYMSSDGGLKNDYEPKTIARHEVLCSLSDVVRAAARLLVPGGHFFMIHKPARLAEIMDVMREYKLEPKRMRMVHPYVDKEPTMVLIEGVRDGGTELRVQAPLILYKEKGVYTDEVYRIYK